MPIIPIFLQENKVNSVQISMTANSSHELIEKIIEDSMSGPGIWNTSKPMIHENARIGGLFASKAFVQLVTNPIIGRATQLIGYEWPLIFGTFLLTISSLGNCIIFKVFL